MGAKDLGKRPFSGYRNGYRSGRQQLSADDVDWQSAPAELKRIVLGWDDLPDSAQLAILTLFNAASGAPEQRDEG